MNTWLKNIKRCIKTRGVLRTQLNIYDQPFLQKQLTAENCQLFSQEISFTNV